MDRNAALSLSLNGAESMKVSDLVDAPWMDHPLFIN